MLSLEGYCVWPPYRFRFLGFFFWEAAGWLGSCMSTALFGSSSGRTSKSRPCTLRMVPRRLIVFDSIPLPGADWVHSMYVPFFIVVLSGCPLQTTTPNDVVFVGDEHEDLQFRGSGEPDGVCGAAARAVPHGYQGLGVVNHLGVA